MANKFRVQDGIIFPDGTELTTAQGIQGLQGADGYLGSDGVQGIQGIQGIDGLTGPQGPSGQGLINQTIILNNVAASVVTNAAVPEWSASYTGTGGQLLVTADITAFSSSSATRNWYLKKNGSTVATGSIYFNTTSSHLTMPSLQYIDTSGSTAAATWSITLGPGLSADVNDHCTILVTEYTGVTSLNISSLTASGDVSGQNLVSTNAVGNEGGEINLAKSPNSTLSGTNVVIDQYADRIRFFESGGSSRGAYIDLTQATTGVGTLLNNRVSGIVNAGSFVTMDNIKATVTTSAPRGLSLATVTGFFNYNIGGTFAGAGVGSGGSSAGGQTLTTTPTSSIFNWGFTVSGDISTYVITNTSSMQSYRITLQIGASFNNNMISIERLI